VPPFVGVAVKITFVPEQMTVEVAAIETLTGRFGLTVIVMLFEAAGLPLAQVAEEVRMQFTISPFARAEVE
jgi:hypothetical protein